jgi:hypothetical protein
MLKISTNAYLSQLSIPAWNIHGLGDTIEDHIFREKLNSDINILLETLLHSLVKQNVTDGI